MKVAVIGCGAMGSYCASKLSLTNEVYAVDAFESKVNQINQNGINIEEDNIVKNYKNIKAYLNGSLNEVMDVVVLFVKSTQSLSALLENKNIIGPKTIVVSLQNGYGNDRDIKRFVEPSQIVLGNTLINCVTKDNVIKRTGNGITRVGSITGDKKNALTAKIMLEKAGFLCEVSNDTLHMVWAKLLVNATLNPLCAMFKCKIKVLFENKYIWEILERLVQECIDVAKLDGVNFSYDDVIENIKKTIFNIGQGYPSMYQDIELKRMTEIERINGAIVNIAYKHDYSAPYNAFVLNSIKALEKLY